MMKLNKLKLKEVTRKSETKEEKYWFLMMKIRRILIISRINRTKKKKSNKSNKKIIAIEKTLHRMNPTLNLQEINPESHAIKSYLKTNPQIFKDSALR